MGLDNNAGVMPLAPPQVAMFDPLSVFLVGAGLLAFREMNKKDYGVLTPARDERYRNAMEHCHDPTVLLSEAKLYSEHGLKAQAAMLKRRAEWRGRPADLKKAHEEVYQKAIKSTNIPAILEVAAAFEGWTATKKSATLRDRARMLQEEMLQNAAKQAAEATKASKTEEKHANGTSIPRNETDPKIEDKPQAVGDDT